MTAVVGGTCRRTCCRRAENGAGGVDDPLTLGRGTAGPTDGDLPMRAKVTMVVRVVGLHRGGPLVT